MPYLPVSAGDVGVHPSEGVRRLIRVLGVVALDLVLRDGIGLARYLVLALEGAHLGRALGEFCPPAGTTSMATLQKITDHAKLARRAGGGSTEQGPLTYFPSLEAKTLVTYTDSTSPLLQGSSKSNHSV